MSLKRLAPQLEVTYTYLSKLENHEIRPSAELIERIATYFKYDTDRLLLSAGRVPDEILQILRNNPDAALDYLRKTFGERA